MIELLARLFIRGRDALAPSALRRAYGQLCGAVGIGLNLLLFAVKFFAGSVSGSIAITADAFNNLSDAGSSLVTLLGFRLAGRKPDPEHPFGHGRMEYISGLVVSGLILLMGVELGKSSLGKILHPEEVASSPLVLVILVVSIGVKLYMFSYNRAVGKKIHSTAMDATAMDSLHRRRAGGNPGGTVYGADDRRLGGPAGGAVYPVLRLQGCQGDPLSPAGTDAGPGIREAHPGDRTVIPGGAERP